MRAAVFFLILLVAISSLFYASRTETKLVTEVAIPALNDESGWANMIDQLGPAAAYAKFKTANEQIEILEQHGNAHTFGEALYQAVGIHGINTCDFAFGAGCLHQIFAEIIATEGIGTKETLFNVCKQTDFTPVQTANCYHAFGHGLAYYYGEEDADGALADCRELKAPDHNVCADGVYMEHISPNFLIDQAEFAELGLEHLSKLCEAAPTEAFATYCYGRFVQRYASELTEKPINDFLPTLTKFCRTIGNESLVDSCFYHLGHLVITTWAPLAHDEIKHYCQFDHSEREYEWCIGGAIDRLNDETFTYPIGYQTLCSEIGTHYTGYACKN